MPQSASARQKLWQEFAQSSLESMEKQYGPEASWSKSLSESYNQGLIAVFTGLTVAAPAARAIAPLARVGRAGGTYGKGLVPGQTTVTPGEAWTGAARPPEPRTFRLRGGAEATGVEVEGRYSRSPFIRGVVQKPYDMASRRIPQEARFVGAFSEARRAGRIEAKRLRRQRRRDLAIAENALREAGLAKESEQLRVMFNRDKPEGIPEEEWLRTLLTDATNMLDESVKAPKRDTPQIGKLRRRIADLEKKVDREGWLVEEEERLANRVEAAKGRGAPTEKAEADLDAIRVQLAIARGEEAPPLPDSPARTAMRDAYARALPPEQVEGAMALADRLARGANPENPSAWLARVVTRWANQPADVRLDPMKALLQEARTAETTQIGATSRVIVNVMEGTQKVKRLARALGNVTEDNMIPVRFLYGDKDERLVPLDDLELRLTPSYHGAATGRWGVPKPQWFSPLLRAVETMKSEKFGRAELENYLKKAPGVKVEEMEFVGRERGFDGGLNELLDNLFKDRKSVTRDEVLSMLNSWVPRFETTHLDEEGQTFYEHQYDVTLGGPKQSYWETLIHWPRHEPGVGDIDESDYYPDEHDLIQAEDPDTGEPLFDDYGDPVYEEPMEPDWDEIQREREDARAANILYEAPHFTQSQGPSAHSDVDDSYEANLMAHIRITERYVGGERTMFLEELQSDWHQQGREKGYYDPEMDQAVRDQDVRLNEVSEAFQDAARTRDVILMESLVPGVKVKFPNGEQWTVLEYEEGSGTVKLDKPQLADAYYKSRGELPYSFRSISDLELAESSPELDEAIAKTEAAYDVLRDARAERERLLDQRGRIADAPWKDTWEELLFREAVMQAINNGHTRIAWTSGAQQAERYNQLMASNISRIEWDDNDDLVAYGPTGEEVFHNTITADRLPDMLGAGLANKLKEQRGEIPEWDPSQVRIDRPKENGHTDRIVGSISDAEPGDTVWVGFPEGDERIEARAAVRQLLVRDTRGQTTVFEWDPQSDFRLSGHGEHMNLDEAKEHIIAYQQGQQERGVRPNTAGRPPAVLEGEGLTMGGGGFQVAYDQKLPGYAKRLLGERPRREKLDSMEVATVEGAAGPIYQIKSGGKVLAESESKIAAMRAAQSGGRDSGTYPLRILVSEDGSGWNVWTQHVSWADKSNVQWGKIVNASPLTREEAMALADGGGRTYGYAWADSRDVERRFYESNEADALDSWVVDIPEKTQVKLMMEGVPRFQAVYPITGGVPVVKGAMELLGNDRYRLSIFGAADISTVVHELGHIAIHDMEPEDIAVLDAEFAEGRSFLRGEWEVEDHERYARGWEQFFLEDIGDDPKLRAVFGRLMSWMRNVYQGAKAYDTPLSPEVEEVFKKRLGKVVREANDPLPPDAAIARWGTLLAAAQSELERAEARAEIARYAGTDAALEADIDDLKKQRDEAMDDNDPDLADDLTEEIRSIERELDERDVLNAVRGKRRQKMLLSRAREIEKALTKPDSRRYAGAQNAADFFQDERETVLRDLFGERYDEMFAGRREQMSRYLAEKGLIPEDEIGEGRGFLPFRRKGTEGSASLKQMAAPVAQRIRGKGKTSALNLHTRNQMILWQQGDYRADIGVLYEQYLRAMTFKYQLDLRTLLHSIGEPIDATSGPKEGWYLIDLEATPLPHHWKEGQNPEQVDAELNRLMEGITADDSQLATTLEKFANRWMTQDAGEVKRPDGTYGSVRQVHPSTVHQLMLPYTGNQLWNPAVKALTLANTMARLSLIYMGPGYIPSNILANAIMLFAERGVFAFSDLLDGARMTTKDSRLVDKILGSLDDRYRGMGRLVRSEMGETVTTAMTRGDTGQVLSGARLAERKTAGVVSSLADDWIRAAAWSGSAKQLGYRTRSRQMELLDGRTEKTRRDREIVAERASQAMIDFDRLSPWEQRWVRPVVFVWPFIRGATAWPFDYVKEHPFRAGAAVAMTYGFGQEQEEELGPTPDYYNSLVPINAERGEVSNVASVNPLGAFGDLLATGSEQVSSLISGEPVGTFRSLAGFLAPPSDLALQIIRGQGEFGEATSIRDILTKAAPEYVPFWGTYADIRDETKPAVQMEQGALDTIQRRVIRFSPQRMNLAILNQQAKERGAAKTVTERMVEAREQARSAWNQIIPGDHMPMEIERSIKAYYTVSEIRAALKDEIKTKHRKSWQPTRREPKLTPLQETAIVWDVLAAQHPDMVEGVPDPREVFDEYGEEGVIKYRRNIERVLFLGKNRADEAVRRAKQMKKAAA